MLDIAQFFKFITVKEVQTNSMPSTMLLSWSYKIDEKVVAIVSIRVWSPPQAKSHYFTSSPPLRCPPWICKFCVNL